MMPASLDDLPVVETIRYTNKQREEMARIRGVMDNLNRVSLLISLRGKSLDYVIEAWWEANGYTDPGGKQA